MDTAANPTHHIQERAILKSNLWKFFKSLRVQANPLYCMLVASPLNYAWITIVDRDNASIRRRITIAQFVGSFKKMPSAGKCYRLGINLYYPSLANTESEKVPQCKKSYHAARLSELSVEIVESLFIGIVAYHCMESLKKGKKLELTPQIISYYKFKARYIEDLQVIIGQCNDILTMKSGT